ncbi:hypothetical protein I4U23_026787 [Adineta vaga]|nr:hypothetical protein I4U23_026787 [Adineta vaga]
MAGPPARNKYGFDSTSTLSTFRKLLRFPGGKDSASKLATQTRRAPSPDPKDTVTRLEPRRLARSFSHGATGYSHLSRTQSLSTNAEQIKETPKQEELDRCAICLDDCTEPKRLDKCGHTFCKECIDQYFQAIKPQCPCCFTIYGDIRGNQPENGRMVHIITRHHLPGFERNSNGTIQITYTFPDGIQDERHPSPGQRYHGTQRTAYLPDNKEGRHILKLLEKAFKLRQVFTIGQSRTTGRENMVTWNDIHHKTSYKGGSENFGYPDKTYLNRVRQELAAKGIE